MLVFSCRETLSSDQFCLHSTLTRLWSSSECISIRFAYIREDLSKGATGFVSDIEVSKPKEFHTPI